MNKDTLSTLEKINEDEAMAFKALEIACGKIVENEKIVKDTKEKLRVAEHWLKEARRIKEIKNEQWTKAFKLTEQYE